MRRHLIILDRRFVLLFMIFVIYGLSYWFLAYNISSVVYLFSDEETFLNFSKLLVNSPFETWGEKIKLCYVGLVPNSNLYGTIAWYSILGKVSEAIGMPVLFMLRFTNIIIGFFTAVVVIKYIEKSTGLVLSKVRLILFTLPILYFSPTLLRDNYIVLFTFLGALSLIERGRGWFITLIACGLLVFIFRHGSILFFIPIVFFRSNWNKPIVGLFIGSLVVVYVLKHPEITVHAVNFRLNFMERYGNANLSKILFLPFPLNELGLLFYSWLGVFPFYTYFISDLPKSFVRWPEMIFSLTLYYFIFKFVLITFLKRINWYNMLFIVALFMIVNIELAMRRQMIVYPILFSTYLISERMYFKSRHVSTTVLLTLSICTYSLLIMSYIILI